MQFYTIILGAKCELDISSILEKNAIFREFKGALSEQYVQQEIRASSDFTPHYWQSESTKAEVDFIIQTCGNVIPLEVKAENNTKAKSLLTYCRKYTPRMAVRISMNDQSQNLVSAESGAPTILFDLPLYATFMLPDICKDILVSPSHTAL